MKIIISHPTGNSFVRAAASGMEKAGSLLEFHTSIASFRGDFLDQVSGFRMLSEFRRRRFDDRLKPYTKTWPMLEAIRQLALKSGMKGLIRHEKGVCSVDAVYRFLDNKVAKRINHKLFSDADAVYAYEDGAEKTFSIARSNGIRCYYDLPIGYWRASKRMLLVESKRWPEWEGTMSGLVDSDDKLARKDRELALADRIVVASRFTAETLKEFPGHLPPISVVPYAFPDVVPGRRYEPLYNRPMRILFVGGLSQRKGIADLFAVADKLGKFISLTVVGLKPTDSCHALNKNLSRHKWIPSLPHDEILKLMRCHDVLVFPSLFEGFGLVITEAMSQGTPVVTTERTAGPDLIINDENGWIINAGQTDDLYHALEKLLLTPGSLKTAGEAAMQTAIGRTWQTYEEELIGVISQDFTKMVKGTNQEL